MNWAERGAALMEQLQGDDYDALGAAGLALVNERLEAEGLRGLAWGAMHYRCEGCGREELREMEVGVEGPPGWRSDGTYIASPFISGKCDRCRGAMSHYDWNRDIAYPEPLPPSALRWFRVPSQPVQYVTQGMYDNGDVIYATGVHAFLALRAEALVLGGSS